METDFIKTVTAPMPRLWKWTSMQLKRAEDVMAAIEKFPPRMRPIGVRGVYYQVVSLPTFQSCSHWRAYGKADKPIIKDVVDEVGNLLKWMRLDPPNYELQVPMDWISDNGRQATVKVGFESTGAFIRQECDLMFKHFSFCKAHNQDTHIEVWVEKAGLLHIVENVVDRYCRQALAVRGYPSVTSLDDYADRVKHFDRAIILYFGDMDVDGTQIPEGFTRDLINDHGVNVEVIRCGLNPNQAGELHADPVGIKGEPEQKKRFIREWGPKAYELDAIPPLEFEQLIYNSLAEYTDMEVLELDDELERKWQDKVQKFKEVVTCYAQKEAKHHGLL